MIILNLNNISLSFGVTKLLDHVSFNLQESEKAGLVGINGAGKSTLFKIISGIIQPDSGEIFMAKGQKIGYLQQNSGLDSSNSIWDEVLSVYSYLIEMENNLKLLEDKITHESNEVILTRLVKEHASLMDRYSSLGGYEYNSKVKGILRGLGFYDSQFELKIQTLSGGQKTRLALAKLLLEEPDILLMDEPTNHLDIHALEWLEDFLKSYRKCVFIISHDRYFLDAVTNKTIELENCECKTYSGNYTSFIKQKSVDREIQQKHYEMQQKEIEKMNAFIEQQKRWNREKNIIAAESRQKAIDRIDKIEKPQNLPDKIKIKFRGSIISGNDVLFIENLSKGYPGKPLFQDISFQLKRDEKVFLLGPNGCGKSTLLKILTGKLEQTSGNFEYGHNVKIGYYDQEQENLDENNTILDEVWNSNEKLTQTDLRNALASFLFKGEDVFKPISCLSGGEKSRVSLVKLMLSASNFLVLDEPTNHLDINSREVLEDALRKYEGTLLVVSHDRYFINKLATRIIELNNCSIISCQGNYSYYLDHIEQFRKKVQVIQEEDKVSVSKLERQATKEEKTKQKRLEKQINDSEQEIHQIELRLSRIDTEMEEAFSDHIRLTQLVEEQNRLKTRLDELYNLWETLVSEKQVSG